MGSPLTTTPLVIIFGSIDRTEPMMR